MSERDKITGPSPQGETVERRGGLTGSGGLQLLVEISENPTVATAVGGAVAGIVGAKVLGSSTPPPPQKPEPPPTGD